MTSCVTFRLTAKNVDPSGPPVRIPSRLGDKTAKSRCSASELHQQIAGLTGFFVDRARTAGHVTNACGWPSSAAIDDGVVTHTRFDNTYVAGKSHALRKN